jgi:hypothetical protein
MIAITGRLFLCENNSTHGLVFLVYDFSFLKLSDLAFGETDLVAFFCCKYTQ